MSDLVCRICEEEYSEANSRVPRILQGCRHTICEECIRKLVIGNEVKCPFDRIKTDVPGGQVNRLKKNYPILESIQELEWSAANGIKDEYENEKKLKIPCDSNCVHIAVVYCRRCDTNLCKSCSTSTHTSDKLSKHVLVKVTEKVEQDIPCPYHPKYVANLYCKKRNCQATSRFMCQICSLTGHHTNHPFLVIDKERTTIQNKISSCFNLLESKKDDIKIKLNCLNGAIQSFQPGDQRNEWKMKILVYYGLLRLQIEASERGSLALLETFANRNIDVLVAEKTKLDEEANFFERLDEDLQKISLLKKQKIIEEKDGVNGTFQKIKQRQMMTVQTPKKLLDFQFYLPPVAAFQFDVASFYETKRLILTGPHSRGCFKIHEAIDCNFEKISMMSTEISCYKSQFGVFEFWKEDDLHKNSDRILQNTNVIYAVQVFGASNLDHLKQLRQMESLRNARFFVAVGKKYGGWEDMQLLDDIQWLLGENSCLLYHQENMGQTIPFV